MLFHLALFPHHIFHSCYRFYHLHLPSYHQRKCHLGIQTIPLIIFHSCHHLYHIHLPLSNQGKFHLGILPLFPHHFFNSCHIFYHLHLPPSHQGKFHLCHIWELPVTHYHKVIVIYPYPFLEVITQFFSCIIFVNGCICI